MIDINLPILIAQILTFLVALYIVWKIAWGPLVSMMRRREDIVRENIEKSKEERQQAEVLKKDYEIQLGAIREESQSIFSQAVKDAQKERDEIIRTAKEEAGKIASGARKELVIEKERLVKELRGEVAGAAGEISKKMIEKNIDKGVQEKNLKEVLYK